MASSNRLVVEVVGDTSKLTSSLNSAQQQINRFAGKSKISSRGADPLLAQVRGLSAQADQLSKRQEEVQRRSDLLNSSFARTGAGALGASIAVNILGRNLQELGGNAGKLGQAFSDLSTGNIVGFVKGLQSINATDPKKLADDLFKFGDAAKATEAANKFAAAGFDTLATAARNAAAAIEAAAVAARKPISFNAIGGGTFGIGTLDPLLGKGKSGAQRPGVSQSQRNQFFDNDVTRALDRAQDGSLQQQVTKLKAVEQTLKQRLAVTKDITRQLRLEDEIAGVQRQQRSIETTIADNAKQRAADAATAAAELKRQREAREKALEELRKQAVQAKQFRALGFAADGSEVVPGADNLRKQLGTLTDRLGSSSVNLSSKLEAQLEGVRKVLSGKFGQVTRESRDKIQQLFDTIRQEFDKGGTGPLTKTTSLNTNRILEGLGLSPAEERAVRARLAAFNSGGQALAAAPGSIGAFGQPVVVQAPPVYLDGQKISTNTRNHNTVHAKSNPKQKRGSR